jgi:hypothetical protein
LTYGAAHRDNAEKEETMKLIILAFLAVLLAPFVLRADSIQTYTTTETVTVFTGCWNPAVCGDPAAFWDALGLPVPVVEPPATDFAPVGPALYTFSEGPGHTIIATPVGDSRIVTPEPSTFLLMCTGLFVLRVLLLKK